MVTLLGFMWIVANIFIIQIFVPDMVGPVSVPVPVPYSVFYRKWRVNRIFQGPAWIYYSFALGMWMWVTGYPSIYPIPTHTN